MPPNLNNLDKNWLIREWNCWYNVPVLLKRTPNEYAFQNTRLHLFPYWPAQWISYRFVNWVPLSVKIKEYHNVRISHVLSIISILDAIQFDNWSLLIDFKFSSINLKSFIKLNIAISVLFNISGLYKWHKFKRFLDNTSAIWLLNPAIYKIDKTFFWMNYYYDSLALSKRVDNKKVKDFSVIS